MLNFATKQEFILDFEEFWKLSSPLSLSLVYLDFGEFWG